MRTIEEIRFAVDARMRAAHAFLVAEGDEDSLFLVEVLVENWADLVALVAQGELEDEKLEDDAKSAPRRDPKQAAIAAAEVRLEALYGEWARGSEATKASLAPEIAELTFVVGEVTASRLHRSAGGHYSQALTDSIMDAYVESLLPELNEARAA